MVREARMWEKTVLTPEELKNIAKKYTIVETWHGVFKAFKAVAEVQAKVT